KADDAGGVLNSRRVGQHIFDFSGDRIGALKGSSVGQLKIDVEIALILVGQKARGNLAAKKGSPCSEHHEEKEREGAFANERAAESNVTVGDTGKGAIEPAEKGLKKAAASCSRAEQERGKRRAESQRVERGQDYGNRNGHGELLIEASSDSGNERGGDEDG